MLSPAARPRRRAGRSATSGSEDHRPRAAPGRAVVAAFARDHPLFPLSRKGEGAEGEREDNPISPKATPISAFAAFTPPNPHGGECEQKHSMAGAKRPTTRRRISDWHDRQGCRA